MLLIGGGVQRLQLHCHIEPFARLFLTQTEAFSGDLRVAAECAKTIR